MKEIMNNIIIKMLWVVSQNNDTAMVVNYLSTTKDGVLVHPRVVFCIVSHKHNITICMQKDINIKES